MNRYSDTSQTASTVSKENSTVTGIRRFAARIGIRKPQSATHSATPSGRHQPAHARTRSGGHVPLIQDPRSAGRDHFVIPFANCRIAFDAAMVRLNAPPTTPSRHRPRPVATILCTVLLAVMVGALTAAPAPAAPGDPYGVQTFSNQTTTLAGAPYTQAGGHPDRNATEFSIPLGTDVSLPGLGVELLNGTYVNPPLGFFGNPAAAPRCTIARIKYFENDTDISECTSGSRVGTALLGLSLEGNEIPPFKAFSLYNLVPERGYPAQFGFKAGGTKVPTIISAFLLPRTESYGLTVGTPNVAAVNITKFTAILCSYGAEGVGSDPAGQKCKPQSGFVGAPFLSNPVDCSRTDPAWTIAIDSAEHAGALRALGIPDLSDPDWKTATDPAPPVTGCEDLVFDPEIATTPLQNQGKGPVQADQPTGLRVALDFPQTNDPTDVGAETDSEALQTPPPKDITVKLPAGLSISPSSADGLQGCSDQASDPAGDQVHYDTTNPVTCPDAAKIGTATALSPLLALHDPNVEDDKDVVIGPDPIPGDVYLLKPHPGDLPLGGNSDGRFRLLIELENPRYGVNIKLPGIATADKATGQLSATFTQNPQLPASHLTVDLKEGQRAPLMTPVTCGKYETTTTMVPWGTPDVPDAHPTAAFNVGSGPGGSGCPASAAARPFTPALTTAGPESTKAGAHSPFVLKISRNDGEQELSSLEAILPKGLAATFTGIPYCSDAALAAAAARTGKAEQSSPSCPASRIGSVTVSAGPGTNPFNTGGTAYLAGPYKGAPMSVAVITPAVAGPFDLGTVVVRNALYVDPETAQGRVVSDPFPKMLDGVPLKLRSIAVRLDRSNFTLNPTNCSPMSVDAVLHSTDGATANPKQYFQVGGCDALGFAPKLHLDLKGGTKRNKNPALTATLTYPKGNYANIASAAVTLPHSEFLDQSHIGTVCTRVQFAAQACPAASVYGYAKAETPLLDNPLEGPVYLRSSDHKLPDLVADLNGQIHIVLAGKVDSGKGGGIRNTFMAVPDAPVSKFTLTMKGGKKSLLVNSENICNKPQHAVANFTAQNGKVYNTKPLLTNDCKKKSKGKKGKGKRRPTRWAIAS